MGISNDEGPVFDQAFACLAMVYCPLAFFNPSSTIS